MKNSIKSLVSVVLMTTSFIVYGQNDVSQLVGGMLSPTPIEEDLQELCDEIGGRVTGSPANEAAVEWAYEKFKSAGLDVQKEAFQMPVYWNEIQTEAKIVGLEFEPLIVPKYHSPAGSFEGPLLSVKKGSVEDFDQYTVEELSAAFVIVELDLCLDINGLFAEYAHATQVEIEARKRNVKGIVFMSSRPNKLLYRFLTMEAVDNTLPQFVMARVDAKRCMRILEGGTPLSIRINSVIDKGDEFISHNVIAEIKGIKYPDEIIVIGAHIDSWALGTGANDNGCNVSMMIDIARQMKGLNIQPDRTIRFALWNGEEQGFFGSQAYTEDHASELDKHLMALSIDIGSGAINGFFTNGREELVRMTDHVLQPVSGLGEFNQINAPIVGTDNFDFMLQGVPNLVGSHKPQFYGPNYHASSDTYDKVDLIQLKKNSAIVAALALGYANMDEGSTQVLKRHNREDIQDMFDAFDLEFTMRMFHVWEPWINGERGRKM